MTTIDEFDAGVREEYEIKLQEALQQMREEQEYQLREVREEVEILYERKVIFCTTIIEVQIRKFYLRKILIIFLPINLNMCFGCSKELSH